MGRPAISSSGLPGRRVAAKRAGMTTLKDMPRLTLATRDPAFPAAALRLPTSGESHHESGTPADRHGIPAPAAAWRIATGLCRWDRREFPAVLYPRMCLIFQEPEPFDG